MSRTEAVLRLYRAAREFTRRVTGVETLEEAALAYAREMGWVSPDSAAWSRACLNADRVTALEARCDELANALRAIVKEPRSMEMRKCAEAVLR